MLQRNNWRTEHSSPYSCAQINSSKAQHAPPGTLQNRAQSLLCASSLRQVKYTYIIPYRCFLSCPWKPAMKEIPKPSLSQFYGYQSPPLISNLNISWLLSVCCWVQYDKWESFNICTTCALQRKRHTHKADVWRHLQTCPCRQGTPAAGWNTLEMLNKAISKGGGPDAH